MVLTFLTILPKENISYNVGFVHPWYFNPAKGTDVKRKVIKALNKKQYSKFTKKKSCLKDGKRLK